MIGAAHQRLGSLLDYACIGKLITTQTAKTPTAGDTITTKKLFFLHSLLQKLENQTQIHINRQLSSF